MSDALWCDVRQALRRLRRSAGFTTVFIITIGLALGATTTTASLLDAIVLRRVFAVEPDRLVSISVSDARTNQPGYIYAETFNAYRDVQQSLSNMSMYFARYFRIEAAGAAIDGLTEGVTANYFDLLGARPASGRFFSDLDSDASPVMVVSDRFRRRLFGDRVDVVGETVKVHGQPVTIVGVTSPKFEGLQFDGGADVFVSLPIMHQLSGSQKIPLRARNMIGRLAPGVSVVDARAELLARWSSIQNETLPSSRPAAEQQALHSQNVDIEPIPSGFSTLRQRYETSITVILVLSVALLAIACVNLAGLMLTRAEAHRHQLAIRLAVGASRARAMRQILLDGVILAFGGFLLSLPITWWTTQELSAMFAFGRSTPLIQSLTPSAPVLAFVVLGAVVIGLTVGFLPAWHATRAGTTAALHASRTVAGTLGRSGRILLVVQVALSMTVLVGAGLFVNTLSKLRTNYESVTGRNVIFTRITRVPGDAKPIGPAYLRTLVDELSAIRGAQSVGLSVYFPALFQVTTLPTTRYSTTNGSPAEVSAVTEFVSPGFFDTFGISRLAGRDFTWADSDTTSLVAIVSKSVANALFGERDAVGQRLRVPSASAVKELEIIGVVTDGPFGNIREPRQAAVFRPILQEPAMTAAPMAHVRFEGDTKTVADGYTRAVESQGRHFVNVLFTFDAFADSALLKERMIAWLSIFVSGLIVVLACIGTYSMLAYAVTARIRELGIRSALGATRKNIVHMIVREGMTLGILGVAVGIAGALAAAGLVRSQLYDVDPRDPSTVAGAALVVILTVAAASLLPALRAAKTDPGHALRQD